MKIGDASDALQFDKQVASRQHSRELDVQMAEQQDMQLRKVVDRGFAIAKNQKELVVQLKEYNVKMVGLLIDTFA